MQLFTKMEENRKEVRKEKRMKREEKEERYIKGGMYVYCIV